MDALKKTKNQILEDLKNIMNIKPRTNDFDFKYIKELKKRLKKNL